MEPHELLLRYPTALDLPEQRAEDATKQPPMAEDATKQPPMASSLGVSIDRRVFRPLRRRDGRRKAAKSSSKEHMSSVPPHGRQRAEADKQRETNEEDAGCTLPDWPPGFGDHDLDLLGLDAMFGLQEDQAAREMDRHSRSNSSCRAGSAPASGRFSPSAADLGEDTWSSSPPPRYSFYHTWTPSPKRRGPPRSDPVSRGAQMRQLWSQDRFLQQSDRRKFDLRPPAKASLQQFQAQLLVPSYVPPHQKRRDALRARIHQQMIAPDLHWTD
jgi:hypothetical protein